MVIDNQTSEKQNYFLFTISDMDLGHCVLSMAKHVGPELRGRESQTLLILCQDDH